MENKDNQRKSVELEVINQVVKLHSLGMDSRTAMRIITDIVWDGGSSFVRPVSAQLKQQVKPVKKTIPAEVLQEELGAEDEMEFDDYDYSMKGGDVQNG